MKETFKQSQEKNWTKKDTKNHAYNSCSGKDEKGSKMVFLFPKHCAYSHINIC